MLKTTTPPKGAFRGVNFMTPQLEGYYAVEDGYAELSSGWCENKPIYGVTFSKGVFDNRPYNRSLMFHTRAQALDFISAGCPADQE